MTTSQHAAALLEDGFVILDHAVDGDTIAKAYSDLAPCFAAAPFCDGLFYGHTTKRFGRLLGRLSNGTNVGIEPNRLSIEAFPR